MIPPLSLIPPPLPLPLDGVPGTIMGDVKVVTTRNLSFIVEWDDGWRSMHSVGTLRQFSGEPKRVVLIGISRAKMAPCRYNGCNWLVRTSAKRSGLCRYHQGYKDCRTPGCGGFINEHNAGGICQSCRKVLKSHPIKPQKVARSLPILENTPLRPRCRHLHLNRRRTWNDTVAAAHRAEGFHRSTLSVAAYWEKDE